MKKLWFVLFVFCSVNVFQGCSSSKTSTQDKPSPFAGKWNFVYEGIYSGSTEIKIDNEGRFEATITVKNDVRTFTNDVSGEVNENGEVTGSIFLSGNRIGSLSGTMKANNGDGIYRTQRGQGVWNSNRK